MYRYWLPNDDCRAKDFHIYLVGFTLTSTAKNEMHEQLQWYIFKDAKSLFNLYLIIFSFISNILHLCSLLSYIGSENWLPKQNYILALILYFVMWLGAIWVAEFSRRAKDISLVLGCFLHSGRVVVHLDTFPIPSSVLSLLKMFTEEINASCPANIWRSTHFVIFIFCKWCKSRILSELTHIMIIKIQKS